MSRRADPIAWAVPLGALAVSALVVWLFRGGSPDGIAISQSAVNEIMGQIRGHTRDKWLAKVDELRVMAAAVGEVRERNFDRIRTRGQGQPYLDQLVRFAKETHAPAPREDLSEREISLWRVFEAAKAAELELNNAYRDIRAAKNALLLEVPPADAVAWVKVALPTRITLDRAALEREVFARDGSVDRFKDAVGNGSSELDAMVMACRKILEKADEIERSSAGEGSVLLDGGDMFGSAAGETLRPDELFLNQDDADAGFKPTPGRVVDAGGRRHDWMFLDKWYVLGPFENRFRANLDASFLPETVIDLDSVAIGKDDRELRWEYWVRDKARIEPKLAPRGCIYYAWTELHVEKAGRYWFALGSDDYGKVWINGKLVWKSSTQPKPFRTDEHVAEYELKEGVNQLLFRCENNGGTMGWSVLVGTMPAEE